MGKQRIMAYRLSNFSIIASGNPNNPALATFDLSLGNGQVVVMGCKLMRSRERKLLYLSLPSYRRGEGWAELVRVDASLRTDICLTARDLYEEQADKLGCQLAD